MGPFGAPFAFCSAFSLTLETPSAVENTHRNSCVVGFTKPCAGLGQT